MFLRTLLRKLFAARERKDVEMVKPFLDHLEDLRWMLVKMIATLALGMVLSFGFRAQLIRVVEHPCTPSWAKISNCTLCTRPIP